MAHTIAMATKTTPTIAQTIATNTCGSAANCVISISGNVTPKNNPSAPINTPNRPKTTVSVLMLLFLAVPSLCSTETEHPHAVQMRRIPH